MSAVNARVPISDEDRLAAELKAITDRLSGLEAPTGTSIYQTVAKLTILVNDIQAALDAYNASRYDNAAIDAKDAAVAASIGPAISGVLAGNVTIGGQFRAPDAVGFNITGTRRTAWLEDATGRLGYASSSERMKRSVRPADEDRLARLLDIVPKSFLYRPEILRRVNLRATYGVDYMPAREIGLIAEELDDAGLYEFVIYDENGVPEGIEYGMLVVALLSIDRAQRVEIDALRADVDEIKRAIG